MMSTTFRNSFLMSWFCIMNFILPCTLSWSPQVLQLPTRRDSFCHRQHQTLSLTQQQLPKVHNRRCYHTTTFMATKKTTSSLGATSKLQFEDTTTEVTNPSISTPSSSLSSFYSSLIEKNVTQSTWLMGLLLFVGCLYNPIKVGAYEDSDYASDTVTAAIESLRNAGSDPKLTFQSYENIAAIITEGRGVGGSINYQGVQLNRGYIADEDTAIYNPGLTLLTESEKERLVEAVITAKKAGLAADSWSDDNELGYSFLKEKLDPLHMTELRGYLTIVPFYGAFLYLIVLAVQQLAPREYFPPAYLGGVALFVIPILVLVAMGPT